MAGSLYAVPVFGWLVSLAPSIVSNMYKCGQETEFWKEFQAGPDNKRDGFLIVRGSSCCPFTLRKVTIPMGKGAGGRP